MMRKRFKYICSVFLATLLLSGSCRALNKEDVSKFLTVGIVGTGIILFTIDCLQGGKKSNQKDDITPSNALKNEVPKNENLNEFTKRELLWIKLLSGEALTDKERTEGNFRYKSCKQFRDDSDENLERYHDYIQLLFPSEDPSGFENKDLYISKKSHVWTNYLKSNPEVLRKIQNTMVENCTRMMKFWKLSTMSPSDHNLLRITRVLKSLKLFGLEEKYNELRRKLESVFGNTKSCKKNGFKETVKFWESTAIIKSLVK